MEEINKRVELIKQNLLQIANKLEINSKISKPLSFNLKIQQKYYLLSEKGYYETIETMKQESLLYLSKLTSIAQEIIKKSQNEKDSLIATKRRKSETVHIEVSKHLDNLRNEYKEKLDKLSFNFERLEKELEMKLEMKNNLENELIERCNILSNAVLSENDYTNKITKFKNDINKLNQEEEEINKKIEDIEAQIQNQEVEINNYNSDDEESSDELKKLSEIENEIIRYENQLHILQKHHESLKINAIPNKSSEMLKNSKIERNEKKEIEIYEKLYKKVVDNLNSK